MDRSQWFPHDVKPVRRGWYELKDKHGYIYSYPFFWDGNQWLRKPHFMSQIILERNEFWRGITREEAERQAGSSGIPTNEEALAQDKPRISMFDELGKLSMQECDKLRLAHVEVLTVLHRLHPELVSKSYAEFIEHAKLAAGALLNNKPSSKEVDAALERGRAWARKLNGAR